MASWLGSLWKGSSASLPYNIQSDPTYDSTRHGSHGWALHDATTKTDGGGEVTAFQASKATLAKTPLRRSASLTDARHAGASQTQLIPALHHFHHIKRLIHPRILRVHATLDTDYPDETKPAPGLAVLDKTLTTGTLIIVTERATPLEDWLEGLDPRTAAANAAAVSWGLHNVVEALGFLHAQAKLAHGLVCPDAVFVTPAGDFKLGGFDLVTPVGPGDAATGEGGGPAPHFRTYEGAVCPPDYRSPERTGRRYDALQASAPLHAVDCYSLAVLIAHVYAHPNAGTGGQVPGPLRKALARMRNEAPRLRPRLAPLLRCPVFDNPYVKAEVFLDEVMTKPVEEKIMFLQSLPDVLHRGVLNESVAIHKILPLLVQSIRVTAGNEAAMTQDFQRRETLAVVPLLFQIAESYLTATPALFQRHVAPLVPLLFAINDRGVRGAVLQRMTLLAAQLDDAAINAAVFEPMCSGFSDSSGPLRELTLKATIILVPKLSHSNLEKLVRYLVRLQADPEASIRTNTVIFIGKIAPNLTDISRQKLILPAFIRSMRDGFTPCRLSALRAVLSCREYFSQKDVAEKVLPCVVPHTLDAADDVREEAFKVVDALMAGLREESRKLAKDAAERISAATCGMGPQGSPGRGEGAPTAGAPASGSYLSGLSSWMTTKDAGDHATGGDLKTTASANGVAAPGPAAPKFSSLSLSDAQIGGAPAHDRGGGGWSDDDGDSPAPSPAVGGDGWDDDDFGAPGLSAGAGGDDDDFFGAFGAKPARPAGKVGALGARSSRLTAPKRMGTAASRTARTAPQMRSATSSGMKIKKPPKPAVKKLPANDLVDGWDDF